jgi:hypothetical protein
MSSELIRKRDSSGKESSATVSVSVEGRSHINSEKTKDFFDLAFKLQIKLLENNYPFRVLSPQQLSSKDMLHGVAIGNDCGSA